ncbi:MAG: ABC transporter ATP-binding protein [Anaerolineae bacterium]
MIRIEHVSKKFREGDRERAVLTDVAAVIADREFVAIVGRSGSGKSTLLNLLAGLDTPTGGDIWMGETRISSLSDRDRTLFRRNHIGFVFQFFNLIPTLTVRENVALTAELSGWSDSRANAQADKLLEAVGLIERRNVFPDKLSGGEQQRVAIARALCADPDVVLADEPTGNLDADTGAQVLDLLTRLAREQGKTMMMVTHSADVAAMADRVLKLDHGRIAADTLLASIPSPTGDANLTPTPNPTGDANLTPTPNPSPANGRGATVEEKRQAGAQ